MSSRTVIRNVSVTVLVEEILLPRLCLPDEELALVEGWRPPPKIWKWRLDVDVLAILDQ